MAIIESAGIQPDVVEYLKDVPSPEDLKNILAKLGMNASEIVRKGEPVFKEKFKGKNFNEEEWIQILVENPKLIERPIVVKDYKAVIGRPPENVNELL